MPFGRKHLPILGMRGPTSYSQNMNAIAATSKALVANITTATVSVRWIITDMSDDPRKISKPIPGKYQNAPLNMLFRDDFSTVI
jgi:hypothetical protein